MNFWEKITGSDLTKEMTHFTMRIKKLPDDYQEAWKKIKSNLWAHSDFSGRSLMKILNGVLDLLEETAAEGHSIKEVLGDDMEGFCQALIGEEGKNYRSKWRKQLNGNIARKLGK